MDEPLAMMKHSVGCLALTLSRDDCSHGMEDRSAICPPTTAPNYPRRLASDTSYLKILQLKERRSVAYAGGTTLEYSSWSSEA
jgi:hypothetical protein